MKKLSTAFTVFLFIASIQSLAQTLISGNITTDTQLGPNGYPADSVYIIGETNVYGTDGPDNITTLTIEPGVTLKFNSRGLSLRIGNASQPGRLVAQGTASNRIVFTSNLPNPTPGDGGSIMLNETSENCILDNVDILYGGYAWQFRPALSIINPSGSNMTISNCNIRYSENRGIYMQNLYIDIDLQNVTVNDCVEDGIYYFTSAEDPSVTFSGCNILNNGGYGIYLKDKVYTHMHNCNFTGNTGNAIFCHAHQVGEIDSTNVFGSDAIIEVEGGIITQDAYWNSFSSTHEVYYLITENIWVEGSAGPDSITTLELEAGCKLSFVPGLNYHPTGLTISWTYEPGRIIAHGTPSERIVLTTEYPGSDHWEGINLYKNAMDCIFENVDILYAGAGVNDQAAVEIFSSTGMPISFSGCNIERSTSSGVSIYTDNSNLIFSNTSLSHNNKYGIIYYDSDTNTVATITDCEISFNYIGIKLHNNSDVLISNCTFNYNFNYHIYCSANHIGNIDGNNIFLTSKPIVVSAGTFVDKDATWHDFNTDFNVPYFIEDGFNVNGYDGPDNITTLVLEPGTKIVLKRTDARAGIGIGSSFGPGRLIAQGTSEKRITFTSAEIDPLPGDWTGITFSSNSKSCVLDNVDTFYGGYEDSYGNGGNLLIDGSQDELTITNSKIAWSATNGVQIKGVPDTLKFNFNDIANNTEHGIHVVSPYDDIANCTWNNIHDNGGYGVMNERETLIDARNCYWGSDDGPAGVGPGSGDEVSEYVMYDPWLTGPLPVNASIIPIPENDFLIYPNPVVEYFDITTDITHGYPLLVTIFNSRSQIIKQHEITTGSARVDIPDLPGGVYYILVQDSEGRKLNSRVMIKKP